MFRYFFGILFCFSVLFGLTAFSDGRSNDLIVPISESTPSPPPADVKPDTSAPSSPAAAGTKSAGCTCENCTCNPCTCDDGVAYQTVYETETYYERSCDGNICRLIPRTRQVARRVAVKAVKAARVASEAADVVREVVTPFQVSGGSTGSYVSQPVYYSSSVSYGSTGTTYQASSFQRVGTVVQAEAWTPRRVRGQPLRNVARRWGWWR